MSEPVVDLRQGDLFDILPTLDENSIDSCVTDPPYGIGFMGREWDTFKPGVEQTRVVENKKIDSDNPNLKGRTRGPASSPSAVEYDRTLNGQRLFQEWTEKWAREVYRVLKPGGYALVFGAPRSYHRMASGLEDAGFEVRDSLMWLFGQGFPKSLNLHGEWEGWGTALKPAFEPIVLARKPFKGTLTNNVLQFRTGALNIDACRIEHDAAVNLAAVQNCQAEQGGHTVTLNVPGHSQATYNAEGRWPSHVMLDEAAAQLLDEQTGVLKSGANPTQRNSPKFQNTYGAFDGTTETPARGADSGGASRFFYCPKPSRKERDLGCGHLPAKTPGECVDRDEDSVGLKSPRAGAGRSGGGRNFHPTVKPVALMRYLVRLVTPPDGTVLDPFTGSGTTGMAARAEGFHFVGSEREDEYMGIALGRIFAVDPPADEAAA